MMCFCTSCYASFYDVQDFLDHKCFIKKGPIPKVSPELTDYDKMLLRGMKISYE